MRANCRWRAADRSGALQAVRAGEVFLVGNMFHPLDELAVESLLDRDVAHRGSRRRAVPVLMPRRAPNHVPGSDFDDRLTLALRPTASGSDEQRLAQRMGMPGGACARLKGDARARDTGGLRRGVQRIDANVSRKPDGGSLQRRLRPGAFQLHDRLSLWVYI